MPAKYKVQLKFYFFLICSFGFTSCQIDRIPDPSLIGETSPCYNTPWISTEPKAIVESEVECLELPDFKQRYVSPAEMLDIALSNNPTTKKAWRDARAYAFAYRVAESIRHPQIDFSQTYNLSNFTSRTRSGRNALLNSNAAAADSDIISDSTGNSSASTSGSAFSNGAVQTLNQNIFISYLLFDFGGREALIESARQALISANWTQNQRILDVMQSVLQAYYSFLQFKGLYKASLESVENAKTTLDAATHQFEAGVATKVDVLQAQSNLVSIQLVLEQNLGQMNTALAALATALGLPGDLKFNVQELPEVLPVLNVSKNVHTLVAIAKNMRPDLAAKEAIYLQKIADYKLAISVSLPTITSNFNATHSNYYGNTNLAYSNYYSAGFAFNVPIFHGFANKNRIRQARENILSASQDWKITEQQIIFDIMLNYYGLQTSEENIKNSEEYLKFAQETYDASLLGYRMGTASILDLLTAQTTLANAKAQRITARTNWAFYLSQLAYSIGVLNIGEEVIPLETTNVDAFFNN